MEPSTVYRPSGDVVMRRVGREALLVPVRNKVGDLDSIFTLNESAILIWQALDGQTPLDRVVERVCAEYDIDRERAAADTGEVIQALLDAGLVERAE
jgi:hypothetical protein